MTHTHTTEHAFTLMGKIINGIRKLGDADSKADPVKRTGLIVYEDTAAGDVARDRSTDDVFVNFGRLGLGVRRHRKTNIPYEELVEDKSYFGHFRCKKCTTTALGPARPVALGVLGPTRPVFTHTHT
jgi:hypothetical protein